MKLNKRMPSLPKWPEIHQEDGGLFVVRGKHATYWRYVTTQFLLWLAILPVMVIPWVAFPDDRDAGFNAFLGSLGFLAVAAIPFTPRILCRMLFPRMTRVEFTREAVRVGRKTYDIRPDAPINFRAFRPAMSELKAKRLEQESLAKRESMHSSWRLRFRRVEMIYGSQIVPITTIADEVKAEQFSVALQEALRLAASPAAARSTETNKSATAPPLAAAEQDILPE